MNHNETNDAVRRSLVATDDGIASHNNVYSLRARRQENAARLLLYPVSRAHARVENVVPLHPQPEPPAAA